MLCVAAAAINANSAFVQLANVSELKENNVLMALSKGERAKIKNNRKGMFRNRNIYI